MTSPVNRNLWILTVVGLLGVGLAGCAEEGVDDDVDADIGPGEDIGPEPGGSPEAFDPGDVDPGPGEDIGDEDTV